MSLVRKTSGVLALFVSVLLLSACDDDPAGPAPEDLAGSYEATTFTLTEDGTDTDVLAEGGSLQITLEVDGTSSGTLVIPATLSESGEEEQESMEGTWTIGDGTVTFDQPADTFVRDMTFTIVSDRLEGEETFGAETVSVVLTLT